jgi:hypothetical protein
MKAKALAVFAVCLFVAGQAQALSLVAGWDFSQSCLAGNLCDPGFGPMDTLDANYSDEDPTSGMGAESAAFGTMHLNGQYTSSTVPGFGGELNPNSPDLTLNTNNHTNFPLVEMGALGNASIMQAEIPGIAYQQHSMLASDTVDAVFRTDLTSALLLGSNWEVRFAALSEGESSVTVSFSEDGVSYTTLLTEELSTAEEVVSVALGGVGLTEAFVKLSFDGVEDDSRFDNLAILADLTVIPEPGTMLLLGGGLAGLAVFGRRRS